MILSSEEVSLHNVLFYVMMREREAKRMSTHDMMKIHLIIDYIPPFLLIGRLIESFQHKEQGYLTQDQFALECRF